VPDEFQMLAGPYVLGGGQPIAIGDLPIRRAGLPGARPWLPDAADTGRARTSGGAAIPDARQEALGPGYLNPGSRARALFRLARGSDP
jgi:hypothetical protein